MRLTLCLLLLGLMATSCGKKSNDKELLVLCGGSMRKALEELKTKYEAQSDVRIVTTYGGSGELCAQIQNTGRGDLYLCHDPFMPWAAEKGLIDDWSTVASLNIVIIVPKGNPKKIKELKDLAQPGLRLGIGNQTYSSSGQIIKHVLKQEPFGEAVQKNVRTETKGHQPRCNDVVMGTLDAAVIWDAVAHLYKDKVEIIPIPVKKYDAITSATYKKSDLQNVRVALGVIAKSEKKDEAREFLEFVKKEGPEVFAELGFSETAKGAER